MTAGRTHPAGWLSAGIVLGTITTCSGNFYPALINEGMTAPASIATTSSPGSSVAAPGRIEPEGGVVRVGAPIDLGASVVRRQFVDQGGWVTKGALLAELDTHAAAQAALEQATRREAAARAQLEDARIGAAAFAASIRDSAVSIAEVELEFARRNLDRGTALSARGDIAAAQQEERILTASRDALALERAHRERDQAAAAYSQGVLVAQALLAEAEAAVVRAEADLERTVIRAPQDAQILRIIAKPGEQIGTAGLCLIGDTRSLYAVADVYETDLPMVKIGQPATITGRALQHALYGSVVGIGLVTGKQELEGLDPANPRGSRVVPVRVLLDPDPTQTVVIGSEVIVSVDIGTGRVQAAAEVNSVKR